tara:strand:- start:6433 stop:7011 length:579 start_codon:yes stop_codon:yes gene_type:complete
MFRRRNSMSLIQRMRELIWPRMGWLRVGAYLRHRVVRLPGSPYSIAAGLACGAAISFTPFIGLHFVLAALMAWLIGGNVIASAIGTAIGNPWTFPFIWWGTLRIGEFIMGSSRLVDVPENLSLHYIFDHPFVVLLPMTIGGILVAFAMWIVVYFTSRYFVERYQRLRAERLNRRREAASVVAGPGGGEGLVP